MNTQNERQSLYLDKAGETSAQAASAFAQFVQGVLTDDPLDATCQGLTVDAFGNVTGLHIGILATPGASYKVRRAHVRGTQECQGNAVMFASVVDQDGIAESTSAIHKLWPYPTFDAEDSPAGDGNGKGEFEISSKFPATAAYGPLGFGVYSPADVLLSDVCFGWGQPEYKPHVGGFIVFQKISVAPDPDPDPEPDGDAMTRIAVAVERLAAHLGA